jgi:hypothetical protein
MTQHKRWPYGTHMMRTPDNSMEERYRKGDWLGVARCFRPKKGKDVVFVDGRGNMVLGERCWVGRMTLGASASFMVSHATP